MAEQKRNVNQVADWNGLSGERWVANQARLDAMLAVFGQAAIEAAAPAMGERVVDVGCGAGTTSLALAARVGAGGQVLGVDISEPLIGRARALTPQDAPAQFRVADASSAELPVGAFDVLYSRFGVMFFDDPTSAFAHMRRALRPGGRVGFDSWGAHFAGALALAAVAPLLASPVLETRDLLRLWLGFAGSFAAGVLLVRVLRGPSSPLPLLVWSGVTLVSWGILGTGAPIAVALAWIPIPLRWSLVGFLRRERPGWRALGLLETALGAWSALWTIVSLG